MGLIFEEASKRVVRKVGLGSPPSMEPFVHKDLTQAASELAVSIDSFGQAIEMVLIKYGKSIVNEQFILNRIANSVFDIYGSVVTLSRASRSLKEGSESAAHEKLMTEAWTLEVIRKLFISGLGTDFFFCLIPGNTTSGCEPESYCQW